MLEPYSDGGRLRQPAWHEGFWPGFYAPWRLLQEIFPREHDELPSIELAEEGPNLVLRAEMPGVKPEDLDVWITDEAITLRGERVAERRTQQQGYFRTERRYGKFHRVVPLPMPVDAAQARATFRNGVLEIEAPKRDPEQGRFGRRLDVTVQ